jgi:hypothetical protein
MYVNLVSKLIILYEVAPLPYKQVNSAMHKFTRGENGSGIPVGYRIRVVQIPIFRIRIRVVLYSGRIRVIPGYCSFGFGSDTERELPGKIPGYSGQIRVPGIRVPVFSFSA